MEKYAGKPLAYVGVNTDHTPQTAKKALRKAGLKFRCWCDGSPSGPIATRWNVHAYPTWYVLDATGKVVARPGSDEILAVVLKNLLK